MVYITVVFFIEHKFKFYSVFAKSFIDVSFFVVIIIVINLYYMSNNMNSIWETLEENLYYLIFTITCIIVYRVSRWGRVPIVTCG